MSATIKIRKETAKRLARMLGELIAKKERKVTYDELINYLLDVVERYEHTSVVKKKELDAAAKRLLETIRNPVRIAGPEDFQEYDYEDIGG